MSESSAPLDARAFRTALGAFATGVTIVTTWDAEAGDIGLTANSFNSVSLDPPMVLWSLSRKARSLPMFQGNPYFAVHVLAADQADLSQRFARQGADKFTGLSLQRGEGNVPLLEDCSARFMCRTAFNHDGGDHVIFVGAVTSFLTFHKPPLIFHAGRYALTVEHQRDNAEQDSWSAEPDSSFSRLLGVTDNRSIADLDRLLWHTGTRVTYERVARLASLGYLQLHGGHDPGARVTLTERGRAIVLQLVAAAKAAEVHAERNLGPGETQLLKFALRNLIRDTDPGPPPLMTPEGD
jgi:3-hydroxy-9,10-secoandrosta-1,3,5(10)-triene-9,17-dione monooxygenase reductase component